MSNKVFGYLRTSTDKQQIDNFKNWILNKANELKIGPVEWIEEPGMSGGKDWMKRELGRLLLDRAKKGDKIITFEASRLGRNIKQSMEFLSQCDRKGVKVYAGDMGEDDTIESTLQLFVSQITSQRERENIKRRTKAALDARKTKGMKLGQPLSIMKLDKNGKGRYRNEKNEEEIHRLIKEGVKIKNIASKYKLHPIVMGRYIKKWDLKKPKEERDSILIDKSIQVCNEAEERYKQNQLLKCNVR